MVLNIQILILLSRSLRSEESLEETSRKTIVSWMQKTYTKQEIATKTPSSVRTIDIPDIVYDAILEQRKLYEASKNRRSKYFLDLDYVSCSSYGRPRSKNFHFQHFKKLLKDLELPDVRWHDLRGTRATILLLNGMIPKAIAENLGHASKIVTIDDYIDKSKIVCC